MPVLQFNLPKDESLMKFVFSAYSKTGETQIQIILHKFSKGHWAFLSVLILLLCKPPSNLFLWAVKMLPLLPAVPSTRGSKARHFNCIVLTTFNTVKGGATCTQISKKVPKLEENNFRGNFAPQNAKLCSSMT
jgi:hypothetical protein